MGNGNLFIWYVFLIIFFLGALEEQDHIEQ